MTFVAKLAAVLFVLCTVAGAQSAYAAIDYTRRDGAAEARAALAAGQPAQIYSHVFNGRSPGYRSPGLSDCAGEGGLQQTKPLFVSLPEADWREGGGYADDRVAAAAQIFAGQFNRVMFLARGTQIRQSCPLGQLDPRWPQVERELSASLAR